jgi:nitrite reductase/ring-hydroxylating ferredoxin subunit
MDRWFPIARSEEAACRHILQAKLLGQEIAAWRDDAGSVNAWENRCPHRGVRLSIGLNEGTELRCRYHGWRYASGSGQCTFIPAHPAQKPAGTLHAGVYGVTERYGFVWVNLVEGLDTPNLPISATEPATTLRSMFVAAPAPLVAESLLRGYRIDAATDAPVVANDTFTLTASGADHGDGNASRLIFLLQPVTDSQVVIHGLLQPRVPTADRIDVLRHHNAQMTALRDAVERLA